MLCQGVRQYQDCYENIEMYFQLQYKMSSWEDTVTLVDVWFLPSMHLLLFMLHFAVSVIGSFAVLSQYQKCLLLFPCLL